jgi:hypothetical protein
MPTLSASDYTTYLKFKAAAASPIRPAIQTRDNATLNQSVLNANILTTQAAYVVTPSTSQTVALAATVTAASTTTVTAARTDVITSVTGNGTLLTYTTSQAHGLTTGDIVTVTGLTQNTLTATPNQTSQAVTVTGGTTFTLAVAATGASSGTGSITGRVYYTTSVANGMVAGDVISITGITTFTASSRTVLAAPTATTFVLSSAATGAAVSGQTGSVTGLVYYTTNAAHGLGAGQQNVTISGLTGTVAYNLSLATIFRAPSSTVFIIQNSATGTAVTGASGVLSITYFANTTTSITGLNYVRPMPPNNVNNPNVLSTVGYAGTSGAMGSSATQRPGGLPTGFKGSQGSYTRLPQNAGWIQGNMVSSGPRRF